MPEKLQPKVGQILHFFRAGGGPEACIVTKVWGEDTVNVCLFADAGHTIPKTGVSVAHGKLMPKGIEYCDFPAVEPIAPVNDGE